VYLERDGGPAKFVEISGVYVCECLLLWVVVSLVCGCECAVWFK